MSTFYVNATIGADDANALREQQTNFFKYAFLNLEIKAFSLLYFQMANIPIGICILEFQFH